MNDPDVPQSASPKAEARIAETPAVFANRAHISPMPGGAEITFVEARRVSGEARASPRAAVFLQHTGLALLRRLLDWTADADARLEAPDVRRTEPLGTPEYQRACRLHKEIADGGLGSLGRRTRDSFISAGATGLLLTSETRRAPPAAPTCESP